jgi:hypothetical protein
MPSSRGRFLLEQEQMSRNKRVAESKPIDIAGSEKKLRQAEFFLAWLQKQSTTPLSGHPLAHAEDEVLEFYFSACLSAAQSVYYILEKTGGMKFKTTQQDWRNSLPKDQGDRFGRMIGLRGDDVHLGVTGAMPLPKYVEDDQALLGSGIFHNEALHGPAPVFEYANPDGKKISGLILRGAVGLYLDLEGMRVEATSTCRDFIDKLRLLLDVMKAACNHDPP